MTILQQSCNNLRTILQLGHSTCEKNFNNLATIFLCYNLAAIFLCNNLGTIFLEVLWLGANNDVIKTKNKKITHLQLSFHKVQQSCKIVEKSCNNPAECKIVCNSEIGTHFISVPCWVNPSALLSCKIFREYSSFHCSKRMFYYL